MKHPVDKSQSEHPNRDLPFDRLYRPMKYGEVVGQAAVVTELHNRILTGELPRTLLFVGPRGTGKTSVARIHAMALNCEDPSDGEPCGVCDSCSAIARAASLAAYEVDAASHTSVEFARWIVELLMYQPVGRWRLIMLDEAHRLSPQAFDALLKSIEEPPEETTFILITTEEAKIPDTIRSRAARYEFLPISEEDIVERLRGVVRERGIGASDEDLTQIAIGAAGSMRDALIRLEQLTHAQEGSKPGPSKAADDRRLARELLKAALEDDRKAVTRVVSSAVRQSRPASNLVDALGDLLGDLASIQAGEGSTAPSVAERAEAELLASSIDEDTVFTAMTEMAKLKGTGSAPTTPRGQAWMAFSVLVQALASR